MIPAEPGAPARPSVWEKPGAPAQPGPPDPGTEGEPADGQADSTQADSSQDDSGQADPGQAPAAADEPERVKRRKPGAARPPLDLPGPPDPADEWISLLTADPADE